MGNFLEEIGKAYKKGIEPFSKAINEIIIEPEKEELAQKRESQKELDEER